MGQTFAAFRTVPFPAAYPPVPTAVTSDVLEIGIAFAFAAVYFSFLLAVLPGHGFLEVCFLHCTITDSIKCVPLRCRVFLCWHS